MAVKKSGISRNFWSPSILWTEFGGTELTVLTGVQEGKLARVVLTWLRELSDTGMETEAAKLAEG